MDRNLMAKLVFLITLPLAAAAANGLHFLSSAREVRRPFLFPPLTTLSAYLRLHGLLVLILICAVASRVWDGLQSTIHFLALPGLAGDLLWMSSGERNAVPYFVASFVAS